MLNKSQIVIMYKSLPDVRHKLIQCYFLCTLTTLVVPIKDILKQYEDSYCFIGSRQNTRIIY